MNNINSSNDISRILICDDNIELLKNLKSNLEKGGISTIIELEADEVIRKSDIPDINIIVMDINLNGNFDGLDAARTIKDKHPEKIIIFMSEYYHDKKIKDKFHDYGFSNNAVINKGIFTSKNTELLYILQNIIAEYKVSNPPVNDSEIYSNKASIYLLNPIDLILYQELHSHPELLHKLNWRIFEELLADILKTFGYDIELTQSTKDGGIDIIAFYNNRDWGKHKYLLQAKRWTKRIGIEPVQRLIFLNEHLKATKSCLATTSTFTKGAWDLYREYRWQLELRDYNGLNDWIERAYIKKLNKNI